MGEKANKCLESLAQIQEFRQSVLDEFEVLDRASKVGSACCLNRLSRKIFSDTGKTQKQYISPVLFYRMLLLFTYRIGLA